MLISSKERFGKIAYSVRPSAFGLALIGTTEKGVRAVFFAETTDALSIALQQRFPGVDLSANEADLAFPAEQILALIASPRKKWDVPLDVQGTEFQKKVWRALQEIPAGTTSSYAEIASKIGHPQAVRAVAGACAANTIAVGIPCHRVVRTDGSLSGYRWGVKIKRALLDEEAGTR